MKRKTKADLLKEIEHLERRVAELEAPGTKPGQAKDALRESEERFRNIIENVPMGVHLYRLGADGALRFVGANPAADKILGVDNSQYIGKTIEEAFPAIVQTEIPQRFRAIAEKGGFWQKEQIDYEDERIVGAFDNFNFQTSPGMMASFFVDITERKRAERALAASNQQMEASNQQVKATDQQLRAANQQLEASNQQLRASEEKLIERESRLRSVVESPMIGILFWDAEGNMTDANSTFLETVGYSRDEVLSGSVRWRDMTPPEYKDQDDEALAEIAAAGAMTPIEKEYIHKDGSRVPILLGAASLPGPELSGVAFVLDITEKKRTEEEIKESRSLLQGVIEGTPDPIFLKDRESRYRLLNSATARALGKGSVEEVIGKDDTELIPLGLARQLQENDRQIMDSGESVQYEERLGDRMYLSMKTPFRDEGGNVVGLLGVARDITERKQAEENRDAAHQQLQASDGQLRAANQQLRATEQQLRAANQQLEAGNQQLTATEQQLRASNQQMGAANLQLRQAQRVGHLGFWDLDVTTGCLYWSDETYRIYGFEPQEFEPTYEKFLSILYPEDHERVQKQVDAALSGDAEYDVDFRFWRPSGEMGWIHCEGEVTRDENGKAVRFFGTQTDISEWKRSENALRQSEERFRHFFDAEPEYCYMLSPEARILDVNRAALDDLGYRKDELVGKHISALYAPEYVGRAKELFIRWKQTGRLRDEEMVVVTKDGRRLTVLLSASAVRAEDGSLLYSVSVQRNIMALRQIEEQLRQSQKMEAVGQLAGGVAHDFNNLLQVISGHVEFAIPGLDGDRDVRKDLEEIRKASERAAALTRQLLAFARRQVLELETLDLNDKIAEALHMLQRMIPENVELQLIPGHHLGRALADPVQMDQILLNLCLNARDAMPDGGRVLIETENVVLDEEYCSSHVWARQGRYALVSITDTGRGIPPENMDRIFEPFFTTKGQGEGTGMGLAMVHGIVEQHQGLIHAYSEVDKGTTFKVYLPIVEQRATEVERPAEGPVRGGEETILVVEDDELVRDMVHEMLQSAGYKVVTATEGEEAVSTLEDRAEEIDLALLDVVMPKMGGRKLYDLMQKRWPHIRVIFNSGYTANAVHTGFVLEKGLTLIQKPYSIDALLRTIRKVLDAPDGGRGGEAE